jgi:hypothetical protein
MMHARFSDDLVIPLGAFFPFNFSPLREAGPFIMQPGTAKVPEFENLSPLSASHVVDRPIQMTLVYVAPVVVCWLITRDQMLVL